MAELTRASDIINEVRQMPDVIELIERLRDPSEEVKADVEDQLITKFKDALYQHGFQRRFRSSIAPFAARIAVNYMSVVAVKQGDSIVVYFLCEAVQSLYQLRLMITSRFIHAVFDLLIESVTDTTGDVSVKVHDDDFNFALLCVSGPQDRGL